MFYIDSCTMRPNHGFANDVIKDAMERGVRLDLVKIREIMDALTIGSNNCMMELRKKYGIANPNSSMQVKDAFMRVIKEEDLKNKPQFKFNTVFANCKQLRIKYSQKQMWHIICLYDGKF